MKTKEISDQLVDCAINMVIYAMPGGMEADKNAIEAYKTLATDMLFLAPQKKLRRIIPFRMEQIRAKGHALSPFKFRLNN